jgi:hypothetical protein
LARSTSTALPLAGIVTVSRLKDKARFKEGVEKLINQFNAPISEQSFVGTEPGPTLEHVTRRHFIDPFLRLLGWDLTQLNEEMIEEARTRGETTLRLDYLGVNQQTRIPVLIVEAKAWAVPFVAASAKKSRAEGPEASQPISLFCSAIEHCKAGGKPKDSPVTLEWADYIAKLHQYVSTIKDESGHTVSRVATLSGQWLVTFNDPGAIFLRQGKVNSLLIGIYRKDELIIKSDAIFDQLARSSITDGFPAMVRPSLLPAYIRATDVKRVYRALWVSRQTTGAHWKPRPSIGFEISMVLERQDGALLTVIDQSLKGWFIPHDYSELDTYIKAVEAQSDELLRRINGELSATLQPSDVEAFPGFPPSPVTGYQIVDNPGNEPRIDLIKPDAAPGEFLLVIGTAKHFLFGSPAVNPCDCHNWVFCQAHGQEQGERPIIARSVEPKAFFTSGEEHHCAHQLVHDRRNVRCQIDVFEEFLCCRACVFQTFCWKPQELAALPCGKVATVAGA